MSKTRFVRGDQGKTSQPEQWRRGRLPGRRCLSQVNSVPDAGAASTFFSLPHKGNGKSRAGKERGNSKEKVMKSKGKGKGGKGKKGC